MRSARVLLAENDAETTGCLTACLESMGVHLLHAADGRTAIEVFGAETPDLLIVDAKLPQVTGLEVLRYVRESRRRNVPVVVLTATTDQRTRQEALEGGAADLLEKPIDRSLLIARVRRLLELRASRLEQEQLLAFIVHDLKQPIAIVTAASEWLLQRKLEQSEQEAVDDIAFASVQLQAMVEDLLAVSKLEHATMPINRHTVCISEFVARLGRTHERTVLRRGLSFAAHTAEQANIEIDKHLMERVAGNIVQNAARYAKNRVSLTAVTVGDDVELRFCNDGPAIPVEQRAEVFEKFSQLSEGRAGSVGLGLYFCRLVVEQHGGKISVTDTPEWSTVFTIALPLARTLLRDQ